MNKLILFLLNIQSQLDFLPYVNFYQNLILEFLVIFLSLFFIKIAIFLSNFSSKFQDFPLILNLVVSQLTRVNQGFTLLLYRDLCVRIPSPIICLSAHDRTAPATISPHCLRRRSHSPSTKSVLELGFGSLCRRSKLKGLGFSICTELGGSMI